MGVQRGSIRTALWVVVALLSGSSVVLGAPVVERIGREENRTQKIGDQTQQVARELDTIVRDLEINRLLTRDENKDFEAARTGMDDIARRGIRAVLDRLAAARQALERAQQQDHLRQTVAAQETLITRLTEELVRIQYRSQLRHLLEQMRTIVTDQRQAITITQTGAIELAATNSDALRSDILDRVTQTQDGVWHDWMLVREQVRVMTQRYGDLPFIETLKVFQSKAREMPVDQRLAETRDNLRGQRFGLAVAAQRQLSDYFLELLKILQTAGLSPAEQRSALENLIEKTEEAIRQEQELRAQTETLGRDLTEPLRNEMARAQDQLANFTKDLAQEAEQVSRSEAPQQTSSTAQTNTPQNPQSPARNPKSEPPADNPWAAQKNQPPPADARQPTSPAANEMNKAADNMSNASNQLIQAKPREASEAQQAAINNLANALAQLRGLLDANAEAAQADSLAEMLDQQGELLDQLGNIIKAQEGLKDQTEKAAQKAPGQQKPESQEASPPEGRKPAAESAPAPAELGRQQASLGNETQEFAAQAAAATPAAQPLGKAVEEMNKAASELGQTQAAQAVPHQNEALNSLRDAERKIAEAMAEALGTAPAMEMLQQMGALDQIIGQIEQMAGQAETMPPVPAPEMAQQAGDISGQLGEMAAAPPIGPAMAAQIKNGSQLMDNASGQLDKGQTPQAADTMHEAASELRSVRGEMAAQANAEIAQAQAAAQSQMQNAQSQQAALSQMAAQAQRAQSMAAAKAKQPSNQPAKGNKGEGFRGLGPTTYDPKKELEKDIENGAWSRLPPHEREQVLQALKEKYPAQYERALIRYYRNLSRLESEK